MFSSASPKHHWLFRGAGLLWLTAIGSAGCGGGEKSTILLRIEKGPAQGVTQLEFGVIVYADAGTPLFAKGVRPQAPQGALEFPHREPGVPAPSRDKAFAVDVRALGGDGAAVACGRAEASDGTLVVLVGENVVPIYLVGTQDHRDWGWCEAGFGVYEDDGQNADAGRGGAIGGPLDARGVDKPRVSPLPECSAVYAGWGNSSSRPGGADPMPPYTFEFCRPEEYGKNVVDGCVRVVPAPSMVCRVRPVWTSVSKVYVENCGQCPVNPASDGGGQ